jgi:O-antigen/teichoic acid export membrane protein
MYLVYLSVALVFCCVGFMFADRVVVFLFGNEWVDIAPALKVGLLLVLSIALMRLLDMLSVAVGFSKINLTVNAVSVAMLLGGIFLSPPQTAAAYVSFIVICQAVHVVVMGWFLRHRINIIFGDPARP